jgi:hypothetical protein
MKMTKNYLPLSVYTVWIAVSLAQVAINLYHVATTLSEFRLTHIVAILVHVGLAGVCIVQRRKARAYVAPAVDASDTSLSERAGRAIFWGSVVFAALVEAFAVYLTIDYLRINARFHVPLTLGSALTQVGMHLMFVGMSYGIVVVMRKAWLDARQPAEAIAVGATEETIAPAVGWWTKDETRQEIRRR